MRTEIDINLNGFPKVYNIAYVKNHYKWINKEKKIKNEWLTILLCAAILHTLGKP
jgi:hypothetical protein